MCLRVDPLKDVAGSSFGKADRLCVVRTRVSSGGSVAQDEHNKSQEVF